MGRVDLVTRMPEEANLKDGGEKGDRLPATLPSWSLAIPLGMMLSASELDKSAGASPGLRSIA